MSKLEALWVDWRSSLWFVPALMVAAALALALLLIELDGRLERDLLGAFPRTFGAGADGSRGMLSAIASSMITVAGLTFSLTIAALAQASSQYTSRVLRNFMRDRANQFVLGFFVGLFAYCLVVLRTIRGGDEGRFIPSLGVLVGLLLALAGIGVLVFFIHHIAASIQASSIISAAAEETMEAVERLFPQELGEEADEGEEANLDRRLAHQTWQAVPARKSGYIQSVDADELLRFAQKRGVVVRMERAVGEFVTKDSALASFAGAGGSDKEVSDELNGIFTISRYRTIEQDAAFGIRQLVDIALKALSPGVNDTTTAVFCVDYLSAILAQLAGRRVETPYRKEGDRVLVITKGVTFETLVAHAFDQIRDSAAGNTAIMERMLGAIETIAARTKRARRRRVLIEQAHLVAELAERSLESDYNRLKVRNRLEATLAALGEEPQEQGKLRFLHQGGPQP